MSARKRRERNKTRAGAKQSGGESRAQSPPPPGPFAPVRTAIFRGLAVVLPPLLTIVIFIWVLGTIEEYVLKPVTSLTRSATVWVISDIRQPEDLTVELQEEATATIDGKEFVRTGDKTFVPKDVYDVVADEDGDITSLSGGVVYKRYVDITYLTPWKVAIVFFSLFILLMYLLGKFMAAGIGRFFWTTFEQGVNRVPIVRNVYTSVKQVSDFVLSDRDIQASRVVAVEWPRRGIWSIGLVTGESMKDIEAAANEPVLSVIVCTSPMPMTGFTVTVKKSETVDLNITIDQAFQFIISCGVVVPPEQMTKLQTRGADAPALVGAGSTSTKG